jgi:hypothetical protein
MIFMWALCSGVSSSGTARASLWHPVGYAVALRLDGPEPLRVAQFRYFAVSGVALQPGFLPREPEIAKA